MPEDAAHPDLAPEGRYTVGRGRMRSAALPAGTTKSSHMSILDALDTSEFHGDGSLNSGAQAVIARLGQLFCSERSMPTLEGWASRAELPESDPHFLVAVEAFALLLEFNDSEVAKLASRMYDASTVYRRALASCDAASTKVEDVKRSFERQSDETSNVFSGLSRTVNGKGKFGAYSRSVSQLVVVPVDLCFLELSEEARTRAAAELREEVARLSLWTENLEELQQVRALISGAESLRKLRRQYVNARSALASEEGAKESASKRVKDLESQLARVFQGVPRICKAGAFFLLVGRHSERSVGSGS